MKSQDFEDKNQIEDPFFIDPSNMREDIHFDNRKWKTGIDDDHFNDTGDVEMNNNLNNHGRHCMFLDNNPNKEF